MARFFKKWTTVFFLFFCNWWLYYYESIKYQVLWSVKDWNSFLSRMRTSITVEDSKHDYQDHLGRYTNAQSDSEGLELIFFSLSIFWSLKFLREPQRIYQIRNWQGGWIFSNAQANCKKSEATFGKLQAKNSHGFLDVALFWCWPLWSVFAISAVIQPFLLPFPICICSIQSSIRNMLSFLDALIHILIHLLIHLSFPFFPWSYPAFYLENRHLLSTYFTLVTVLDTRDSNNNNKKMCAV